jgi:hypothetical protein
VGKYIPPVRPPFRTANEAGIDDGRFRLMRRFGDTSVCFKVNGVLVCPPHTGQDYGNFHDGAPVLAQHDGVVEFIGHTGQKTAEHPTGMAGYTVIIRFSDRYRQVACHMIDASSPFKVNDAVQRGQQIGRVGSTGQVDGAHLHNELTERGKSIDPAPHLAAGRLPTEEDEAMAVLLRPVRERWNIPAGAVLFTGGPELGERKEFTSPEKRWSCAETVDGQWREVEFDDEIIWIRRNDMTPVADTRNPRHGFGSPTI